MQMLSIGARSHVDYVIVTTVIRVSIIDSIVFNSGKYIINVHEEKDILKLEYIFKLIAKWGSGAHGQYGDVIMKKKSVAIVKENNGRV